MICVGGNTSEEDRSGPLTVDTLSLDYEEDGRGEELLKEAFLGNRGIVKVNEWVYLRCMI